ncbi:MAG TPA: photosystem I reaction center subunit PsaK [Coleofasciculaceae cyanobacterium]
MVICLTSLSKRRYNVLSFELLAVIEPHTVAWSPSVGLLMTFCCLFSVAVGRYAIRRRGVGPKLPVEVPALFEGFGIPELLATMSFGHILGAGLILGLSNAGLL